MRFCMFLLSACALCIASSASAHGPQIQITVDTSNGNKIVTRQLLPGNAYSSTNGLTAPASVYVMPLNPIQHTPNASYTRTVARVQPLGTQTFGPGFTYGYDQVASPGGPHLFTANLELHLDGLEIWNGSAFENTGLSKEQLGLLQSSSNLGADTHKTIMGGDIHVPIAISPTYEATAPAGSDPFGMNAHSSVRYQLLGDGNIPDENQPSTKSRDGVYLVTLALSGTQSSPSLMPSDTFYFILGKNVATPDLMNVVNSFAAGQGIASNRIQYAPNAVPEPSAALLLAVAALSISALPSVRRQRN